MADVARFDRVARFYDRVVPAGDPETLRRGFAYAAREVKSVLDLAGGTGRATDAFDANDVSVEQRATATAFDTTDGSVEQGATATAFDGRVVTVLDASTGMLREADAKGRRVVRGDATRLPFADGSFDAVVVSDALHHLDARAAVAEAARVLRPGGVLVAREFDPRGPRGRLLVAAEAAVGFDSSFLAPGALAGLLADAGLRPHGVASGFEYVLAGAKPER